MGRRRLGRVDQEGREGQGDGGDLVE